MQNVGNFRLVVFLYIILAPPKTRTSKKRSVVLLSVHQMVLFTLRIPIAFMYSILHHATAVSHPCGIAVDGQGCMSVCDYPHSCVRGYGPNGKLIATWGIGATP